MGVSEPVGVWFLLFGELDLYRCTSTVPCAGAGWAYLCYLSGVGSGGEMRRQRG